MGAPSNNTPVPSEGITGAMANEEADRLRSDMERIPGALGTLGNNAPLIGLGGPGTRPRQFDRPAGAIIRQGAAAVRPVGHL